VGAGRQLFVGRGLPVTWRDAWTNSGEELVLRVDSFRDFDIAPTMKCSAASTTLLAALERDDMFDTDWNLTWPSLRGALHLIKVARERPNVGT
jgi:hypothetical protein